jgi:pilus assembly protein CpaF
MILMAGIDFPMRAVREQLSRALDLVVHIERFGDGSRRVTHITEVQRMESDIVTLQDIFEYQIDRTHTGGAGTLRYTGLRPAAAKFDLHGMTLPKYMTAHEFGQASQQQQQQQRSLSPISRRPGR